MAFLAICFVARLANSAFYLASPCFAHLIPESLRRDHAGLIQRFLRVRLRGSPIITLVLTNKALTIIA